MTVQTMALVAAVILAILVIAPLIISILPRPHDPQAGVGIGCPMMLSLALLVPSGLLAWGHYGGHPTLVKVIFWALVVVVGYVAVMGTAMLVARLRS